MPSVEYNVWCRDDMQPLKIAINIARVGGFGGVARNLYTLTRALDAQIIDIYAMQVSEQGFLPQGPNVTVRELEWTSAGPQIKIDRSKRYDLFLYFASRSPVYLGNHLRVRTKVVIPNGNDVRPIEQHFDYVICQAEDGTRYFDDQTKAVVITPCVTIPVDHTEPVPNPPEKFFLTVFNPYDMSRNYEDGFKPVKGHDLVYELADSLALPLVWCHSSQSVACDQNIGQHRNILHLDGLSQERMYYLYEKATAYVSFSREESFGWAVTDAMMYDKPIISRRTGVLSSISIPATGLYPYQDSQQLRQLLQSTTFDSGHYDKEIFSPRLFEQEILALARQSAAHKQT